MAPSSESAIEPRKPAAAPRGTSGHWGGSGEAAAAAAGCSAVPSTQKTRPISSPPATLAPVPTTDTPPLVPGGTDAPLITSRGLCRLRTPNSEAHVSALQHA